jgi:hypothetical protein
MTSAGLGISPSNQIAKKSLFLHDLQDTNRQMERVIVTDAARGDEPRQQDRDCISKADPIIQLSAHLADRGRDKPDIALRLNIERGPSSRSPDGPHCAECQLRPQEGGLFVSAFEMLHLLYSYNLFI